MGRWAISKLLSRVVMLFFLTEVVCLYVDLMVILCLCVRVCVRVRACVCTVKELMV